MTRVVPSMPRFGTIEPVRGSGSPRTPATAAAARTPDERLQRPPSPPAGRLHGERQERDRADRREHGPGNEQQARPRVAPEDGEPRDANAA